MDVVVYWLSPCLEFCVVNFKSVVWLRNVMEYTVNRSETHVAKPVGPIWHSSIGIHVMSPIRG